jgi:hypothetical protein
MALDPLSSVLDLGKTLLDKFIPDPKAKAEALQKLEEMRQNGDLAIIAGQNNINMVEAGSKLTFVSGWRPFVGWVCGSALAIEMVIGPLAVWGSKLMGHPVDFPVLDTSLLTTLLVGMLGLGGMRTVEKLQGVASK